MLGHFSPRFAEHASLQLAKLDPPAPKAFPLSPELCALHLQPEELACLAGDFRDDRSQTGILAATFRTSLAGQNNHFSHKINNHMQNLICMLIAKRGVVVVAPHSCVPVTDTGSGIDTALLLLLLLPLPPLLPLLLRSLLVAAAAVVVVALVVAVVEEEEQK